MTFERWMALIWAEAAVLCTSVMVGGGLYVGGLVQVHIALAAG